MLLCTELHLHTLQLDVGTRTYCYIATQGPMESTAADFWQMAWEQKVRIIVAATDDKVPVLYILQQLIRWARVWAKSHSFANKKIIQPTGDPRVLIDQNSDKSIGCVTFYQL